jgi:hypothetical protein
VAAEEVYAFASRNWGPQSPAQGAAAVAGRGLRGRRTAAADWAHLEGCLVQAHQSGPAWRSPVVLAWWAGRRGRGLQATRLALEAETELVWRQVQKAGLSGVGERPGAEVAGAG